MKKFRVEQTPGSRRLLELAAHLRGDELGVLVLVAERLVKGRAQYGTLRVATDNRSFPNEALEEVADALVYAAVALMHQAAAEGAGGIKQG
jgi:hypothetical protein